MWRENEKAQDSSGEAPACSFSLNTCQSRKEVCACACVCVLVQRCARRFRFDPFSTLTFMLLPANCALVPVT